MCNCTSVCLECIDDLLAERDIHMRQLADVWALTKFLSSEYKGDIHVAPGSSTITGAIKVIKGQQDLIEQYRRALSDVRKLAGQLY